MVDILAHVKQNVYQNTTPLGQPPPEQEDRAAIYARASKDADGDELSVTRQLEDGRARAQYRRVPVIDEYVDNDISASGKRKRPSFERLLDDIRSGRVNVIISTEISRITRGAPGDEIRLYELGMERGLRLWLTRGQDLDLSTATGRLMASWMIGIARHEIEQKGERQKRANLQAARQGRWVSGRRPFGYEPDGVTIRPDEAQAVKDGYADLLAGVSLGMIAAEWNRRGFTAQTGYRADRKGVPSQWDRSGVRTVLTNPRYAGLRSYVPGADKLTRSVIRVRVDSVVAKAEWPAIVSEDTWRAAVSILLDPSRYTGVRSTIALLTGLARCQCGAEVHGGKNQLGTRTYRCKGKPGCFCRAAEPIDLYVVKVLLKRLSRPDAVGLLASEADHPDVMEIRRDVQVIRRRLDQVVTEFADSDDLSPAEFRTIRDRLRSRLAVAEARLADAGRADVLSPLVLAAEGVSDPEERFRAVETKWSGLDRVRQRGIVSATISVSISPVGRGHRRFDPTSVRIEWLR